jgi:hypothetical protein
MDGSGGVGGVGVFGVGGDPGVPGCRLFDREEDVVDGADPGRFRLVKSFFLFGVGMAETCSFIEKKLEA